MRSYSIWVICLKYFLFEEDDEGEEAADLGVDGDGVWGEHGGER